VATILKEPQFIGDVWHTNMGGLKESEIIKIPNIIKEYLVPVFLEEYEYLDIRLILTCAMAVSKRSPNILCLRGDNCKFNPSHCLHPGAFVLQEEASWRFTPDKLSFKLYTLKEKHPETAADAWRDIKGVLWTSSRLSALPEELLPYVKTSGKGDKTISLKHLLEYINLREGNNSCHLCSLNG